MSTRERSEEERVGAMDKYAQLRIFPEEIGERTWRHAVDDWKSRKLTADERRHGPLCNAPDGIYIATLSERTPAERFEMAHLLNLASRGTRSTHANGFVPADHYDSAIAIAKGRVVGGAIADRGRTMRKTLELKSDGGYKSGSAAGVELRPVMWDLWVHPAHRQKGLGRQLLSAMAEHFECSVEQMGFRFPISKKARLLLWSVGLRKVEGRD